MKLIKNVCVMLCAVILVWLAASYIDCNMHNDVTKDSYQSYSNWNLITLIEKCNPNY